mgnify:CR=1 FL=1
MKIDHIGFVTSDLNNSIKIFRDLLGLKQITNKIKEPAHQVEIIFFDLGNRGYPALEVISPLSKNSKVSNFLSKKGDGLHHIAYEVEDIDSKILELEKKNFLTLSDIVPGAGHNNTPTIWLFSPNSQLIELVQKQKNKSNLKRFTI